MKYIFCLCCFAAVYASHGQYPEKKWFDKSDSVYGYYVVIPPSSGRVQAALVLLDGYGGNADGFLTETKIHNVAWTNDLLTICIPTANRLFLDESMLQLINQTIDAAKKTYQLRSDQFVFGGMSSGGTIALRYAELCVESRPALPAQPRAVFVIDSPLDLFDLYKSSERDIAKNNNGWWLGESQMIIDRLKNELGDPYKDLTKFKKVSPLLIADKDSTNEKLLAHMAVRTYHDVDINWHIQNRGRSVYDINLADGSELISRLVNIGNKNAEFVASKVEGRRSNGMRHPHSWNIADETELVQWIREKLNFYPDHAGASYEYTAPDSWAAETIVFPIDFARSLHYKGFEKLRFAPGWGKDGDEKWAYTILWWLDGDYNFDEKMLQQDVEAYFTGLTKQRAVADKLDMQQYLPAKAVVQKVKTDAGDLQTFTASISIFDAQVTKKPGQLYMKIHVKNIPDKTKAIVLFEIAGNPFNEKVWAQLDKINAGFKRVVNRP